MKHYLVKEIQTCYVEYVVRADSVPEATSKSKEIDQDTQQLLNCPIYIKTNSYEVSRLKDDESDPVIVSAIKRIALNYVDDTPDPPKKRRPRGKAKVKARDKELDEVLTFVQKSKEKK
jgi:hypothetical protein